MNNQRFGIFDSEYSKFLVTSEVQVLALLLHQNLHMDSKKEVVKQQGLIGDPMMTYLVRGLVLAPVLA